MRTEPIGLRMAGGTGGAWALSAEWTSTGRPALTCLRTCPTWSQIHRHLHMRKLRLMFYLMFTDIMIIWFLLSTVSFQSLVVETVKSGNYFSNNGCVEWSLKLSSIPKCGRCAGPGNLESQRRPGLSVFRVSRLAYSCLVSLFLLPTSNISDHYFSSLLQSLLLCKGVLA